MRRDLQTHSYDWDPGIVRDGRAPAPQLDAVMRREIRR